jgi:radical SAM protein with 4Fe4S-binding SPASM domain
MSISFSEGVGKKYENNCMIGSDMIAIDASGDYSGCYFFTNQKANGADVAILGNIFQDKLYIDRYKTFQNLFNEMLETEEQCKSCNYKNACYQCPAGNLDTGSAMFRPDDMCQGIVKLYLDLQNDITKKNYKNKFNILLQSCNDEPEQTVFTRALVHLMYRMSTNIFTTTEEIDLHLTKCKPENLMYAWKRMVETKHRPKAKNVEEFLNEIDLSGELDLQSLYHFLTSSIGVPKTADMPMEDLTVRVGYLTLLHMIVLNKDGKLFEQSPIEKLFSV